MEAVVITGLTSIVVVLLTATLAYLANRRQSLRQYQLARVDAKLYGPLMALSSANARALKQFRTVWVPDRERPFADGQSLTEEQLALWRAWVTNVFMPANRRMREVIVDRADLLRGDTMPEELIAFCAHVATLEELIARWDRGDVSVSTPIYAYPASFDPHTTLPSLIFASLSHILSMKTYLALYILIVRRAFPGDRIPQPNGAVVPAA